VAVSGTVTQSLVDNQQATPAAGPQFSTSNSANSSAPPLMRAAGGPTTSFNQGLRDVTSTITPEVFLIAIGCILLIAILGSALPAWLIARIRPAEVLRTE